MRAVYHIASESQFVHGAVDHPIDIVHIVVRTLERGIRDVIGSYGTACNLFQRECGGEACDLDVSVPFVVELAGERRAFLPVADEKVLIQAIVEFGGILQVYVIVVYRNLLPLCDGGHLDGCEADGVAAEIIDEDTVGHLYYAYGIRLCYNPVAFTHLGTCLVHRDIGNYHRLPFQLGDCLGGEVGNINAGVYFFPSKPLVAP